MPASWVVVAVSATYLAACLVVGIMPGRKASNTADGYVAGDRTLGLFLMYFITGATIFSAFAFLGAPGWTYSRGAAAFYIMASGAFGFVPFYFLGARAARLGREYGFVTQAELVARRFDSRGLAGLMALISVVALVPYLALQMKGAGYILSVATRGTISEAVGAAVVYGVVLVYVLRSGVLGVGWTNTFQGLLMMVLAWGLGLYLPYKLHGGVGPMFEHIAAEKPALLLAPGLASSGQPWPWGEYSSAVLVSFVGFSVWPHLFMKAFTARDIPTLRRTVILYPTFQLFLLPIFLIGFAGVFFTPAPGQPDEILPHMLMHMDIPALVVGLFCAGALAASMSSGDAMVHAAAAIAIRDGVVQACHRDLDPKQQQRLIRFTVVVIMLLGYVVAIVYQGSLVQLLLSSYGAVVQFAPTVVAALYWRRATRTSVLAGMLVGAAITAILVVRPELRPFPLHAGLYGLVVNLVIVVVVTLASPVRSDDRQDQFLAVARGED